MKKIFATFLFLSIALFSFGFLPSVSRGDQIDDLKAKITERNQAIADLEKEIASYEGKLNEVGAQAETLKTRIQTLNLTINKLNRDISVTENQIKTAGYTIEQLALEINNRNEQIELNLNTVAKLIRTVDQNEAQTLAEMVLTYDNISEVWNDIENASQLQKNVRAHIASLTAIRVDLENKKSSQEEEKDRLDGLKKNLSSQQAVVNQNKNTQSKLLSDTKNKESEYQKILAENLRKKEAFERELFEFESQLQIAIDPTKLPTSGTGVLKWPLESIVVTQYFGNTDFATKNSQIYNGKGHTGVDFRATIGTPILAAGGGVVSGSGNTDLVKGCYSYGRWVMIDHKNGLSTLYAHLSVTQVKEGQEVSAGEIIAYSGNTGYATGPHLHFTVYATEGVRVVQYANSINCKNAVIPIADPKAYLNPLSYL